MGVCADDQADVLEAEVAHGQGPLQLSERAGLVHAGVKQDHSAFARDRPRVAVRNARPRERQAKTEDAGEHSLAAPEFTLTDRLGRRGR
jgi:hypothetical protein